MSREEREALIASVQSYGETGSDDLLDTICKGFYDLNPTGKSVTIPAHSSNAACLRLLVLLQNEPDATIRSKGWYFLAVLCDRASNSAAFDCLAQLQTSNILTLATTASTCFVGRYDHEAQMCLKFLCIFTKTDGARQILLGTTPGFFEALLNALDYHFECASATCVVQHSLLNVLTNTLGRSFQTNRCNVDLFVSNDGFRIVNKVFDLVYKNAKEIARISGVGKYLEEEIDVLNSALCALQSCHAALTYVSFEGTGIPGTSYRYDNDGIQRTTELLYNFFDLSNNAKFKESTMASFINYCELIRKYDTRSYANLQSVLLYRAAPSTRTAVLGVSGAPFVIKVLRLGRSSDLFHMREKVMQVLGTYGSILPAVDRLIDAELGSGVGSTISTTAEVTKCAYPGCFVNSLNCSTLKKCSRCKSVSYCGKEHQTAHWMVHKVYCTSL